MSDFKCVEIKMLQDQKFAAIRIVDWHTEQGVFRALVKQKKMKDMNGNPTFGKMSGFNREDLTFLTNNWERMLAVFDNKENEIEPQPIPPKEELDLDEVSF
jgi:hypothetical protein